jgi:hypothetical protein
LRLSGAAVSHAVVVVLLFAGYVGLMAGLFGYLAWQVRDRDPGDNDGEL